MKSKTVYQVTLSLLAAILFISGNLSLVEAQTSLDDIRKGYAAATFVMPAGDSKYGKVKVWTQSGLEDNLVVYKENPNRFQPLWSELIITLADGTAIRPSGIESYNSKNFINVAFEDKVLWVPFGAISTIQRLSKNRKRHCLDFRLKKRYMADFASK